ncbi:MAG: oligosaccharide flippase family protein [Cecembia sp.]
MKVLNSNKSLVLLDQGLFSGNSFFTTILVARLLSPEDFGLWASYLLGIYLVLSGLSAFVIQPFQVLLPKISNKKAYITFTFWLELLAITLIVFITFIGIEVIKNSNYTLIVFFGTAFVFFDFGRRLLLAIDKVKNVLILDILATVCTISAFILFYMGNVKELNELISLFTIAYLVPTIYFIYVIQPFYWDKDLFIKSLNLHLNEGKWLFLSAVTQWWSSNFLVVSAGIFLGTVALGALRLSQTLMGVLNVILQTFENYILPQTAKKLSDNYSMGLDYLVNNIKKASVVFLPLIVFTIACSADILTFTGGEEYASYAYVLRGLGFLYILVFFSQPLRLMIRAMLLNQHFFYGYLFSLFFALISSRFLLTNLGLTGALIGLAISQMLLMIYWSFVLQKKKIDLWKSFISY